MADDENSDLVANDAEQESDKGTAANSLSRYHPPGLKRFSLDYNISFVSSVQFFLVKDSGPLVSTHNPNVSSNRSQISLIVG